MSATSAVLTTEKAPAGQISAPPLRVSFSWTLAGNVVYAATQFGILSALAKLGNPAVVGQYALALAISAPVFMFTNLQLRGVQATDARSEYEFGHYFTLRVLTSLCGLLIVSTIAYASGYDRATAFIVLLVAVAKSIESLSDVAAGLLQKHERLDQVAVGLIAKGLLSIVAVAVVYRAFHNLALAVFALVCSWAVVAFGYDLRLAARRVGNVRGFWTTDIATTWRLVCVSAPLGVVMALVSLNVNLPRYVISRELGTLQLGIFAALSYLALAVGPIVNALGQSASPRLSRLFASGDLRSFKSLLGKLVLLGGSAGVLGLVAASVLGRRLVVLIYAPEYANYMGTFLIMVASVGVGAVASFLGYGMTAARQFRAQVPVILTATTATGVGSLLLVGRLGMAGAAVSMLTAMALQSLGSVIIIYKAVSDAEKRS